MSLKVATAIALRKVEASRYFSFLRAERMMWVSAVGILVMLIFYVYTKGFVSLSSDEFTKALIAWNGLRDPGEWFSTLWLPGQLPLVGIAYIAIGDLLTASRFVSILGGIVVVMSIYRLGKHMGDSRVGGIAAALCATQPLVVWLSATGLADILYAAPFFLGFSYFLELPWTPFHFYMASALFTISCTFHYNAWLAVAPLGAVIVYDIWAQGIRRLGLSLGLCIIAFVPVTWCIWNWLQYGNLLYFLHAHIEKSSAIYEAWGSGPASMKSAFFWIVETTLHYDPILAVLAVTSIAALLTESKRRELILLWFVLLVFTGGLILLFAHGGLPTAYPDRYLLVPSLLMAALSAHVLGRLLATQDRYVRAFAGLLLGATLAVNFTLTRHAPLAHERIREAAMIAQLLEKQRWPEAGKVLLEPNRSYAAAVVSVFLNNPQMIIEDRAQSQPEQSVLMQSKDVMRRFARVNGIDRIAVWSDGVQAHVKEWGLQSLGRAGTYTIYRLD